MKTFYIYSESELELGSEQVDLQHFPHQHLITNPNAIKGSPKLLKQPQHELHAAAAVQVLPIKAKLINMNQIQNRLNHKRQLNNNILFYFSFLFLI